LKKVFILDASALISLLESENGADVVLDIFEKAENGEVSIIMNKINLFEVYYGLYREKGKECAVNTVNNVRNSAVKIGNFTDDIFKEAGRLKATYKISLADSIVLAQALITGGELLTADHHEFDIIEQSGENIKFHWIRPKRQ